MSEKRELTQDFIDGLTEGLKISNIYGVSKEITDKELSDLLDSCTIVKPDKAREIQIDAINKTKEVQALNFELEKSAEFADNLAANLQKLGVNFLAQ